LFPINIFWTKMARNLWRTWFWTIFLQCSNLIDFHPENTPISWKCFKWIIRSNQIKEKLQNPKFPRYKTLHKRKKNWNMKNIFSTVCTMYFVVAFDTCWLCLAQRFTLLFDVHDWKVRFFFWIVSGGSFWLKILVIDP
jgi:hypothetical protein